MKVLIYNKENLKKILRNSESDKNIVAFVCTSLDNVAGGLERQLVRVANELYKKGFKITVNY